MDRGSVVVGVSEKKSPRIKGGEKHALRVDTDAEWASSHQRWSVYRLRFLLCLQEK